MVQFNRRTKHIANMSPKSVDITLEWLCQELEQSAEQGHTLDLIDVWDGYCKIASDAQINISSSFLSQGSTFKDKFADHLEGIYK